LYDQQRWRCWFVAITVNFSEFGEEYYERFRRGEDYYQSLRRSASLRQFFREALPDEHMVENTPTRRQMRIILLMKVWDKILPQAKNDRTSSVHGQNIGGSSDDVDQITPSSMEVNKLNKS
jgi:hypothetical protein